MLTSVLIDTYIGCGGRYGLSGAPILPTEQAASYAPVERSHSPHDAPGSPIHASNDDASRDAIPLGKYGSEAPDAVPQQHVLFDEDDPFENSSTAE